MEPNQRASAKKSAAVGAILGACVGDASGAPLENIGHIPSKSQVHNAMKMSGGSAIHIARGQVTDDGEQTLSLAIALSECGKNFDVNNIAKMYAKWANSNPFGAGMTTFESIGAAARMEQSKAHREHLNQVGYAAVMTTAANKMCMLSKANGSLMRASALGVWGHQLSDQDLAHYAHLDSALSHPNPACLDSVAAYSIAIASLLRDPGDNMKAFNRANAWAQQNACQEVKTWLEEAANNIPIAYYPNAGFIKIGFGHAFRHLYLGTQFEIAIQETLMGGGDTDTNACIVGGLLGALWGEENIPAHMKEPVLTCQTSSGRPRPDWLHPKQISSLVDKILSNWADSS